MANCKGCGARIIWATLDDLTKVPLDPKTPTYQERLSPGLTTWSRSGAMVSHVATCSKAKENGRALKKEVPNVVA
jgi:hypothetical protein